MMQVVHICDEAIVRQQEPNSSQQHSKVDTMIAVIRNRLLKNCAQKPHRLILV